MRVRTAWVVPLLFGSGTCALIYQVAWLREMRLIFGASTAASAAVLAIFMGGLGLGGALLGRRADAHPKPLLFYAQLELMIAVSSAATPALVWLARQAYIAVGGSVVLGLSGATAVRLLLATFVLSVPTVLMGGTLPAAAKAVETDADVSRRNVAILYGTNTLGAVTGAFLSTFVLLEAMGTRRSLWLACSLNTVVALVAWAMARSHGTRTVSPPRVAAPSPTAAREPVASGTTSPSSTLPARAPAPAAGASRAPAWFVLGAAAGVGFAFFLMELVWYRMLAPLLGGSSFTFGLILAVALLGIALGGAAYALSDKDREATLIGFGLTCTLEAACIAYPYALGDQLAVLTIVARPLGCIGFYGLVLGWTEVAMLVVLPAAFVAGVQFPTLIALLGSGGEKVGRHVGLAYAWNTVGAIAGALAGGFGLLPLLSAPGTWRAVVEMLVALGMIALGLAVRAERRWLRFVLPLGAATAAILMSRATGPTAVWRHTPIGAGRAVDITAAVKKNDLLDWMNQRRRILKWEVDGVESTIGILKGDTGLAFALNGKVDGNTRIDAATQVMGGLLGALLHPKPTRALVVGLGTGSTAGWLGSVPSMEQVEVVELEPAMREMARLSGPVNQNVLQNPKVQIFIGDAREVLLTARERYDIIFSEPSNPFRAGIASLYTREFYQAVASRLTEGGIFTQWLQAYEIDAKTVRTAYATLASVFPVVETWATQGTDMLLVGSLKPISYDAVVLRQRIAQEPFKTALARVWRVTSLEGVLAHYIAAPSLATAIAAREGDALNTDDRPLLEFAFARSVGRSDLTPVSEILRTARARNEHRPQITRGYVNWSKVEDERAAWSTAESVNPTILPEFSVDQQYRLTAEQQYVGGNMTQAAETWRAQVVEPSGPTEVAVLAEALAESGSDEALGYIEELRAFQPAEADALLARLRWRQERVEEATVAFEAAFRRYDTDPWPLLGIMSRALDKASMMAAAHREVAPRLYRALKSPFAVFVQEEKRTGVMARLATYMDFKSVCVEALAPFEPHVPWEDEFLRARVTCYEATNYPLRDKAKQDLDAFLKEQPSKFDSDLN